MSNTLTTQTIDAQLQMMERAWGGPWFNCPHCSEVLLPPNPQGFIRAEGSFVYCSGRKCLESSGGIRRLVRRQDVMEEE